MPDSDSQGSAAAITWAQRRVLVGLGLLHSLFLAIAFWPEVARFGLHLLVFPAVWALAGVVRCSEAWRGVKPRYIAYWAALGVLPFWAFEQAWMTRIAGLAAVGPLVLAHTVHTFVILWVTVRARRRWPRLPLWLVLATVWAGVEFFRGDIGFDGYPWYFIAHPLIDGLWLRAPAAVVGVYGLNWLVVALATAMFEARIGCGGWGWGLWRESGRVMWAPAGLLVAWTVLALLAMSAPFNTDSTPRDAIRVAVIQTNVPQDVKLGWSGYERMHDLSRFMALTRRAAALEPRPDVIVWPETMFPGEALDEASAQALDRAQMMFVVEGERDEMLAKIRALPGLEDIQVYVMRDGERGPRCGIAMEEPNKRVLALQQEIGIPMIMGGIAYDGLSIATRAGEATTWKSKHNSAFLIDQGQVGAKRYDKLHLTPFGEVMPYVSNWPWLERLFMRIGAGAGGMKFDLVPGDGPVAFQIPRAWTRARAIAKSEPESSLTPGTARVATPICFEATMAHVCRRLARGTDGSGGVDLFIQITNDGWFGSWNAGRHEHLRLARWRCTELGLPMVRAANTGISCEIDASGAMVERGLDESFTQAANSAWDIDREGIAAYSVSFDRVGPTVYRRIGDVAGWAAMIAALALGLMSLGPAIRGGNR